MNNLQKECEIEYNVFALTPEVFVEHSLELFHFQYSHNSYYRQFVDALKVNPRSVERLADIPFLPVSFFKDYEIKTTEFVPGVVFESSGTTRSKNSRHFVKDIELYKKSFLTAFTRFYGEISEWCVIGLLPSYLEREHSSLVFMVKEMIDCCGHPQAGFYLYDHEKLKKVLEANEASSQKTLLIGVTFALLDFATEYPLQLEHTTVMETGGMKGRRKEITRRAVHEFLNNRFGTKVIHSEYGMSELLSQAYSKGNGLFQCPPWMKILIRDEDDPLTVTDSRSLMSGSTVSGLVNVIDHANRYSCAFLATDDIGTLYPDGSFEILGRRDSSDLRGCSLLV
ncbi:MAG TPA: acyl transferase [Parasegetibacter sp.]